EGSVFPAGSNFGMSTNFGGLAGQNGQVAGGTAGTAATVTISGQSMSINGTVGGAFASLSVLSPNPFTNSTYSGMSLMAANLNFNNRGATRGQAAVREAVPLYCGRVDGASRRAAPPIAGTL